jgi:dTDP-4-dehydrorhamnose 3,5-epimerase
VPDLRYLRILLRQPIGDSRGYLERIFCSEELQALAPDRHIAQINHTFTAARSTVRGMHFQRPPHSEIKFVSCLRGAVFDVAVDLRDNSPTFLSWHAEVLSADNYKTLVIPEGFAHGFQTLTDDCEMLYFHTAAYQPNAEGGLNPEDPRLAIKWPLPVTGLSPRDVAHPFLDNDFTGVGL